jgi:F-type H+-transporting ATPase subunit b
MGLEWGQIVTQIIGFLLAVWILKKFAWKPLLGLLEERRQKIKSEFDNIEVERKKADSLKLQFDNQLKEIDAIGRLKIQEAIREGQKLANEIKENARKEAKGIREKAEGELVRDIAKAKVQLRNDLINITISTTEKLLKEKLDERKQRELINRFINEVEDSR